MSDRLLAVTRKGLFELVRGDGAWRAAGSHFLGSPVSMCLRDPRDGVLYAALDLGHFGVKLHRSEDDGRTWDEVATPSYEGLSGEQPPSLTLIWALEPGGASQPGVLWAGTIPGGLFRSEDRGASWSLVRGLWDDPMREKWFGGGYDKPGIHSICVHPADPDRVAVAVSTGGVWETRDGGGTWRLGGEGLRAEYMPPDQAYAPVHQDVHRMSRCAEAPDNLWIQHHNGIFRSVEGVERWSEIVASPSSFGFAVAAHPKDPLTAWFVPAVRDQDRYPVDARFIVNRTRDGGRSFEALNRGLPEGPAYDLVYRHGLDVDETGERLAMGSTTGSLWITEDGGDAWRQVSAHLPPIYAVRFA
jgi:hypothetical protein